MFRSLIVALAVAGAALLPTLAQATPSNLHLDVAVAGSSAQTGAIYSHLYSLGGTLSYEATHRLTLMADLSESWEHDALGGTQSASAVFPSAGLAADYRLTPHTSLSVRFGDLPQVNPLLTPLHPATPHGISVELTRRLF